MDKREAIRAMLDGKKVYQDHWEVLAWIYFKDDKFINNRGDWVNMNSESCDDWLIYQEPKQKKLVELKCYGYKDNNFIFGFPDIGDVVRQGFPYTIKDGKIFVEIEE